MARTAQNIIDEVKSNRFPWMTQAEGLKYVNDTHKELIGAVPELRRTPYSTPYSINVVQGTREYILPLTLNQIDRVEYTPAGGTAVQLAQKTIEYISHGVTVGNKDTIWLLITTQSPPTAFYISHQATGNFLGLDTLPPSAGVLKVYGSDINALVASDQVLPLFSDEVYIEGVCWRLMKAKRKGDIAIGYQATYLACMDQVKNWAASFLEGYQNTGEMVNARQR